MKLSRLYEKLKSIFPGAIFREADWTLFLFLVLMMNVKLWIKALALIFIYCRRFHLGFGFSWKRSRLPLFYLAVLVIAVANWIFYGLYQHLHYAGVLLSGLLFWIACILAIHQVKLSTEQATEAKLHSTLILFFGLNLLVSASDILRIMVETSTWNPYRFQGMYQKYFIETGDYIRGLAFDTSTTNALINAFGVLYFLIRRKPLWTMACMIVLLLTGSNLTNIFLLAALVFIFIRQSDRQQKSQITLCVLLLAIFLGRVSPQNDHYLLSSAKQILKIPDHTPVDGAITEVEDPAEQHQVDIAMAYLDSLRKSWISSNNNPVPEINWVRPAIPQPDLNSRPFQSRMDTTTLQRKLIAFSKSQYADTAWFRKNRTSLPGKIVAFQETLAFLKSHPSRILSGAGTGNFSSKLAFRASGLNIDGKYPAEYAYIHPDFLENHLRLFLYYFTQHKDVHSIIHTPDSLLNQLGAEYGMAGLVCFVLFYLGWFTLRVKKTSFSIPLLIIMTGAFLTGYWFEQLSVVILFELLMLMDMKFHGENTFIKKIKSS